MLSGRRMLFIGDSYTCVAGLLLLTGLAVVHA